MVTIYYYENNIELTSEQFKSKLKQLPFQWRHKIVRYRRWQDRQASLYGKLLLIEGLKNIKIYLDNDVEFRFSENDRPSLPEANIDFNISHTDGVVICAISQENKVGIDIEFIKDIGLEYYTETMTPTQWNEINSNPNRLHTFFKYWTMKESVLKVDGRGITVPLESMEVEKNIVELDSKKWHITPLSIREEGYIAHLASEVENIPYKIRTIELVEPCCKL